MEKIKILVNVLFYTELVLVLDSVFSWNLTEGLIQTAGLIMLICTIWLFVIVNKKVK